MKISFSRPDMKKTAVIYILISLLLFSCSGKKTYRVGKTTQKKPTATKIEKINGSYLINGKKYYPISNSSGFVQLGKASWYGGKFQGRKTANGETYDMYKLSAAHKILPFETIVKVENLTNDKYTIVRINDRGPFVKGRIIDLSYAAAKEIDIIGPGTANVRVTAIKNNEEEPVFESGTFTVQVHAFVEKANAEALADKLRPIYDYVKVSEYLNERNEKFFKVHVTRSNTLKKAREMEKELEDTGFTDAFIVRF
jgi:rare lipoprotein A